MKRVLKNPWIVKGAASDTHAGAAGFINHLAGSFGSDDVAVADDRNGLDCLHDRADTGKVHNTPKALLAGAAMDENPRDTCVFESARQIRRSDVVVIPAQPHFGSDRDF